MDLSDLSTTVRALDDANVKPALRTALQEATIESLDEKVASQPDFNQKLTANDPLNTVTDQEREQALRHGFKTKFSHIDGLPYFLNSAII